MGMCIRTISPPVKLSSLISICEDSKDEFEEMAKVLETSHVIGYVIVDEGEKIPTDVSAMKSPFVDDFVAWKESPGVGVMDGHENMMKTYTPDAQEQHPPLS